MMTIITVLFTLIILPSSPLLFTEYIPAWAHKPIPEDDMTLQAVMEEFADDARELQPVAAASPSPIAAAAPVLLYLTSLDEADMDRYFGLLRPTLIEVRVL